MRVTVTQPFTKENAMLHPGRPAYVVRCSATFQKNIAHSPIRVDVFIADVNAKTVETWFPGRAKPFPALLVLRDGSTEEQRVLVRGTLLRVHATQLPEVAYDFQFTPLPGQPIENVRFDLMRSNIERLIVERPNGQAACICNEGYLILPTRTPPAPPSVPTPERRAARSTFRS